MPDPNPLAAHSAHTSPPAATHRVEELSDGRLRAAAPAKVNLSLLVHGRRDDGFHELTSLVTFADVADILELHPGAGHALHVSGPTAGQIDGANLIDRAATRLRALSPTVRLGDVTLEKRLPVGAGLGGGSADVAAYLRLVRAANPDLPEAIDWGDLSATLGADVPVCLAGVPCIMTGKGEQLTPVRISARAAVLANPGIHVNTGAVFHALAAAPMARDADLTSRLDDALVVGRNHLEAPARHVAPGIGDARQALEERPEVTDVFLSGSGATYVGVTSDELGATAACAALRAAHPTWWIEAVTLAGTSGEE
ncbi:MAG: 4-(cytidine 5'-diphospho)-2-C-methyl-D-erythritol kinase [Pseudomonadota bacterium]